MRLLLVLAGAALGVRDAEFPRIPYIKRIKMPSLEDLMKQQEEYKKQNEIDSWRWKAVEHLN